MPFQLYAFIIITNSELRFICGVKVYAIRFRWIIFFFKKKKKNNNNNNQVSSIERIKWFSQEHLHHIRLTTPILLSNQDIKATMQRW
jgi:hypothetical protein